MNMQINQFLKVELFKITCSVQVSQGIYFLQAKKAHHAIMLHYNTCSLTSLGAYSLLDVRDHNAVFGSYTILLSP